MTEVDGIITVEEPPATEITLPEGIGSEEFCKKFAEELGKGSRWRSAQGLADIMKVDAEELQKWLCQQTTLRIKPGKTEGVYFYGLADRVEKAEETGRTRLRSHEKFVKTEERYALAQLHQVYGLFHSVMKTYAMDIGDRDPDAFTHFLKAKNEMESGLAIFSTKLHADVSKLPRYQG